ncbi:hypothetical protein [Sphingomonas sp.]|uniref:hypothetical protein n=1 Tax=Sphingomonas sp. TaxID=28214 RepID=UPI002ED9C244
MGGSTFKLAFDRLRAVIGATAKRTPGRTLAVAVSALGIATALKEMGDGVSIAGQPARIVVGTAIVAVILAALWFAAAAIRAFVRPGADPVGLIDLGNDQELDPYYCHVIDTVEGARRLTLDVTSAVFPHSNIPLDVVEAAQQHNNRRLIALVERANGRTVGWATVWPVTPEAGQAVESGKKPDDELVLADLLPRAMNKRAEYIVILAVGLLPSHRNLPGGTLLRTLGRALLWHIHDEFYEDKASRKALRILAIGDSPAGRRMCERLGLTANGANARFAKVAELKPVYSAAFTRRELLAKISENFR